MGSIRTVAILLFDDVEVLDFAGPLEVFGLARTASGERAFEVVTISINPGDVLACNNLRVVPTRAGSQPSVVDILVIPGGIGTRREMVNPEMLEFIRGASSSARLTLSVCTGALLLGAAGLLMGRSATTHWAAMDELRSLDTGADILPDARVVDNGDVVMSAGVSAGIDAALHIVARLFGPAQAEKTARAMEYDWDSAGVPSRKVVSAVR